MDISNGSIGGRIRKTREERGYTLEQLAEYSEISATFLWEIETGKKGMKTQVLGRIATALDVPTDYLIFGEVPYRPNAKINSMVSDQPAEIQKQLEKLIAVFLDTVDIRSRNDSSEKE